jgi:hypothetical protein
MIIQSSNIILSNTHTHTHTTQAASVPYIVTDPDTRDRHGVYTAPSGSLPLIMGHYRTREIARQLRYVSVFVCVVYAWFHVTPLTYTYSHYHRTIHYITPYTTALYYTSTTLHHQGCGLGEAEEADRPSIQWHAK